MVRRKVFLVTLVSERGKKVYVLNLLFSGVEKNNVYLVCKTIVCILHIDNDAEEKLLSCKLFLSSYTRKNYLVQL